MTTVETTDGTRGYGETGYLNPRATADFINREIADQLVGMNPLETTRLAGLCQKGVKYEPKFFELNQPGTRLE